MNGLRWVGLWPIALVWLAAVAGCFNAVDREPKPKHRASTRQPVSKVELDSSAEAINLTKAAPVTATPNLPPGATLLDPDMVWERLNPDSFVISPDGKSIAYISKGAIWICKIAAGPPLKLADLPNTLTSYWSKSNYRQVRSEFNRLDSTVGVGAFHSHKHKRSSRIVDLQWTPSQDGIFYTIVHGSQSMPYTTNYQVIHASTKGVLTTVATVVRDTYDEPDYFWRFDVSRDRSKVVASGYTPLIWNALTDRPLATRFDYLLPSSSSGRFLGIEIDTRQLVITDEDLKIEKRLNVTFNPKEFCNMFWSPDERFAICVNRLEYAFQNKNKWVGFRIDLETGEQCPLKDGRFTTRNSREDYVVDQFAFTGHAGEVIRVGVEDLVHRGYADGRNGTYVALVPDGKGFPTTLSEFLKPPRRSRTGDRITRNPYPPVRLSRGGGPFAMAFPREGEKRGHRYWLFDRDGNKWPMGPDDPSLLASPYHVVALADNGQQIVACDDVQLFSIPVATIQAAEGLNDE